MARPRRSPRPLTLSATSWERSQLELAVEARLAELEVPRHQPVGFDDSRDPLTPRVSFSFTPARPPVVGLAAYPLRQRRPAVLSPRSRFFRGVGPPRMSGIGAFPYPARRIPPPSPSKSNLLFNVLATPFSRRARHCVKRHVRREVLFALRKEGRINRRSPGGAGGYRRTESSLWRC